MLLVLWLLRLGLLMMLLLLRRRRRRRRPAAVLHRVHGERIWELFDDEVRFDIL